MQRPTRILVFAILCLVVGFFSGISNLGGLIEALLGPNFRPVPPEDASQGMFGQMMRDTALAMRSALEQPAYRITLGVESLIGSLFAAALIVAGIGLLRGQFWALRLARAWACYALLAAALTVVLQVRFVLPGVSSAVPGTEIFSAMCMLPLLWAFPVLILTLLSRPVVTDYLRRPKHPPVEQAAIAPHLQPPADADAAPSPQTPPTAPRARPSVPSSDPLQDTWRDDPWNDPKSQ